jgi:hypothetical protein
MANADRPNGLRPVKHLNGSPYNGQANKYYIASGDGTATFIGDLVKLAGSASADGYPTVVQGTAGAAAVGVVVGFAADPTNLNTPQYRAASTARYVLVADAPDLIFEIQADDVGTTLAVTDVGLTCDVVVAAGSTTTGASGMELDSSDAATAPTTANCRIMGFVDRADNEIGVANQKVLVMINNHQLTAGVVGAPV